MSLRIRNRGGVAYIWGYKYGKEIRKTTGVSAVEYELNEKFKKLAHKRLEEHEAKLDEAHNKLIGKQSTTFEELAGLWLAKCEAEESRADSYYVQAPSNIKRLGGSVPISAMDTSYFETKVKQWERDGLSPASQEKYIGFAKAVLKFAEREGLLKTLPIFPTFTYNNERDTHWTEEQGIRFLEWVEENYSFHLAFAFCCLLHLGARVNELWRVKLSDVDGEHVRMLDASR